MKIYLLPAGLLLTLLSCNQTSKPVDTQKADTPEIAQRADTSNNVKKTRVPDDGYDAPPDNGWTDSLLAAYIKKPGNDLVALALKDTSVHEKWLFDSTERTDSATYFVYNVGHDNSLGKREGIVYASDCWILIDSATRKLYECQPNESLKEWKH